MRDLSELIGLELCPRIVTITEQDALLYAVAVGSTELDLVWERDCACFRRWLRRWDCGPWRRSATRVSMTESIFMTSASPILASAGTPPVQTKCCGFKQLATLNQHVRTSGDRPSSVRNGGEDRSHRRGDLETRRAMARWDEDG